MKKLYKIIIASLILYAPINAYSYETKAEFAILMDHQTGAILFQKNADERMIPSSMTKLMTAYIAFERLQKDVLKLDDKFTVSEKAWRKGGSKMFLRHTDRVDIESLLNGIIVQSGNDACITLAEGISSSEDSFANLMNTTGKEIGLTNSNFKNATGWPDEDHYMSAKDIATLSMHIIKDFPEYYHYFSKAEYKYNDIKQSNRNILLSRNIGVDGLKTGHTEDAGYGMSASAIRDGKRLIVVVNGLSSELERADEAEKLLNYGFRYFDEKTLFKNGDKIETAEVWQGESKTVNMMVNQDITLLVPKLNEDKITIEVKYESPIVAPIKKGTQVATMVIQIPDMGKHTFPLVAADNVERASWFARAIYNLKMYISGE